MRTCDQATTPRRRAVAAGHPFVFVFSARARVAGSAAIVAVAAAEAMAPPEATPEVLFEDIYVCGSEPQFLRGRIPEENFYYPDRPVQIPDSPARS